MQNVMANLSSFRVWLRGMIAAVIGGVSSAGLAYLSMNGAAAAGVDVPNLNLKALGIILLTSGLVSLFAYLKQSPIPPSAQIYVQGEDINTQ